MFENHLIYVKMWEVLGKIIGFISIFFFNFQNVIIVSSVETIVLQKLQKRF